MSKIIKSLIAIALFMGSAVTTFGQGNQLDDRQDNVIIYYYNMDQVGDLPLTVYYTVDFVNYNCPQVSSTETGNFEISSPNSNFRVWGNYIPYNSDCWYSDEIHVTLTIYVDSETYTATKITDGSPYVYFRPRDFGIGVFPIEAEEKPGTVTPPGAG